LQQAAYEGGAFGVVLGALGWVFVEMGEVVIAEVALEFGGEFGRDFDLASLRQVVGGELDYRGPAGIVRLASASIR